ncbi:MAG: 5'-deoxynucleotidase [Bdellovibrionaceae bacterium]|nr:5'-deoxynucleotidase [Pseudobdellovibrionaceae bacterium]
MAASGFHFFAYLARMKLIDRWSLMRCTQRENVQEHSLQVAMVAHALALVKNKYFEGRVPAEKVAVCAIFHDATEVITGDLPTPVKYSNPEISEAYKAIEGRAAEQLLKLLPPDFQSEYRGLFAASDEEGEIRDLIKAADSLCAYIKCLEEIAAGNTEFSRAKKSIEDKVRSLQSRPEVDYFVRHFIPGFSLTLDELSEPLES